MPHTCIPGRQFVRVTAMQQLYAFFIARQANKQLVFKEMNQAIAPNFFSQEILSQEEVKERCSKANAVLADLLKHTPLVAHLLDSGAIPEELIIPLKKVIASYNAYNQQDYIMLKNGWQTTIEVIKFSCCYIFHLLYTWQHMVEKGIVDMKINDDQQCNWRLDHLLNNPCLNFIRNDNCFLDLLKRYQAVLPIDAQLIKLGYQQLLKTIHAPVQICQEPSLVAKPNKNAKHPLLQDVVFLHPDIQYFFEQNDLGWSLHKGIVNKLIHQALSATKADQIMSALQQITLLEKQANNTTFYQNLLEQFINNESVINQILASATNQFAVDRIFLLDKIIIQLGICELLYLPDIPYQVTINEYLNIAKAYSTPKSSQFVNGILNRITKEQVIQNNKANKAYKN